MIDNILTELVEEIKNKMEGWFEGLNENFDFEWIEKGLNGIMNASAARILKKVLTDFLGSDGVLKKLKIAGGRMGMRFKEYRKLTVRLYNGHSIEIETPFFIKAGLKRGRKKRGPNGRGYHLGLQLIGFIGNCSSMFAGYVVKTAVLSPSFNVAKEVLGDQGIQIDVKTIRRLCQKLGEIGIEMRGKISLEGNEDLKGLTLVIGIDGGRLRERKRKRGKRRADQKRQGYSTDWREPKLFTVYLLNGEGKMVKEFKPLHDATMGNHEEMFMMLRKYLKELKTVEVSRVVFCGDGVSWIWSGVEALKKEFGWKEVYEVIDYTHAKQNINKIIELLPNKYGKQQKTINNWYNLLWKGDIDGLYNEICKMIKGRKRGQAIRKWKNYFQRNQERMQYERFKGSYIPCGSGCVESAIRRVINMRLKSAGTFWLKPMAECFLFLRSQLLSGRWKIFMKNTVRRWRDQSFNFSE